MKEKLPQLILEPIGVIRTSMRAKFDAPHQPQDGAETQGVIELLPGRGFEKALKDLERFDRIWLLWWFSRNKTWRPLVRPPRGPEVRRGVFATRSPHRPNPLGLTAVRLLSVDGLKLTVGNNDLVDGTPIFDIKPYLPNVDAFPETSSGWLSEIEAALKAPPAFQVEFSALAAEQIRWLKDAWQVDFMTRAAELLSRDPSPHRTRRIWRHGPGKYRMGCGPWRLLFSISDKRVLIENVFRGYPERTLAREGAQIIQDYEAQLAFVERWPEGRLEAWSRKNSK